MSTQGVLVFQPPLEDDEEGMACPECEGVLWCDASCVTRKHQRMEKNRRKLTGFGTKSFGTKATT